MKKIFALALIGISVLAYADKNNKPAPASEPKTKTAQTDTAYRFGFVADTSNKPVLNQERMYDQRLGRYYHIDPVQNSPYDSLQRK